MDYMELGEVAHRLGLSQQRVRELADRGSIPVAMRVGRRGLRLFDPAAIERVAREREAAKAAAAA
jgi:DNA-binding transcriptional MerR regulator